MSDSRETKVAVAGVLCALVLPILVHAQVSSTSSTVETLLAQIKILQAKIAELRAVQTVQAPQIRVPPPSLSRNLRFGMKGDDVRALQEFLRQFPEIYPEGLVTGYFGRLTEIAVQLFQTKHNIVNSGTAVTTGYGQVGPKTLTVMRATSGNILTTAKPLLTPPPNAQLLNPTSSTTPTNTATAGASGGGGGGGGGESRISASDTAAPIISNIASSSVSATTATITWTTNESSNSKVSFSTNSNLSSASSALDLSNVTSHSIGLSGLSQSTIYYFVVVSNDTSNNTATSSIFSFRTTTTPDTTPPMVSNVSSGSITSTSATITWTTNESSNSRVAYSTNSNLPSPTTVTNSSSITSHNVNLTGLTHSTTYYYAVSSTDTANNTSATSTTQSFTTSAPDTTPPIISNVTFDDDSVWELSGDENGYADIGWETNELAGGKIYAHTAFPVNIALAEVVSQSSPTTDQDFGFELCDDPDPGCLLFNTTYYFLIVATDVSGNAATSSSASYTFTTGNPPDAEPPTISNIVVSNITSTSARISWDITDTSPILDDGYSEVSYGTVAGSPSHNATPNDHIGTTPNYSRILNLSGLSPNTTYYYSIHEHDFATNQADSIESSFTTLSI